MINIKDYFSNKKDNSAKEVSNIAQSQKSSKTAAIIPETVKRLFKTIAHEMIPSISQKDIFLYAVDNAYDSLPLQRKIVLSREKFQNMMLKIREEYHNNQGSIIDQQLEEFIKEAYSKHSL